ncbi:MAG: hypothetical protein PVH61_40560 [Candidatus Aminicenantes bacterium]|jgi:hypothetical protein
MEFEVVEIRVKCEPGKKVSLSYAGKPVNLTEPIWQQSVDAGKENKIPAAFIIKKCKAALEKTTLEVKINITNAKPGKYKLTGSCISEDGCLCSKKFSGFFEVKETENKNSSGLEKSVEVCIETEPVEFLSISSDWTWKITSNNTNQCSKFKKTPLELYWLYDGIDYSIFRKGVPVEILRHVAVAYQANCGNLINLPIKKILIAALVNWCFYRNPPRYDIYSVSGKPHYIFSVANLDHISFLLYDYLNSIHDPNALCTCYDMAAVLQLYLKAVGIKEVKFCKISKFGYLKLTPLIGRGLCNNPSYDDLKELPVVPEKWQNRKEFNHHVCCCIESCGCGCIIDACIGPHTGNETFDQYRFNVVDKVYPNSKKNPKTAYIECFNGVTHINWIQDIKMSKDFRNKMKILRKKIGNLNEWKGNLTNYVILSWWPDFQACRVLGADWEVFFEETIAGYNRAMRSWKLRRKGESIDLKVYVSSSKKVRDSMLLFAAVAFMPSTSSDEIIVDEEMKLCKIVPEIPKGNFNRYICVIDNIVFDVSFKNVTFPEIEFIDCLKKLAINNRTTVTPSKAIPRPILNVENVKTNEMKVNTRGKVLFTIEIKEKLFIDFHLSGNGLQLIRQIEKQDDNGNRLELEFLALKPSGNTLYLTAVDKDTLLSQTKTYKITVNQQPARE